MRKDRVLSFIAVLVFAMAAPAVTSADVLGPGGSGLPDTLNISGTLDTSTSGSWALVNILSQTVATGSYKEWVVTDTFTTHLDFVFALTSDAGSEDTVGTAAVSNYLSFFTDVGAGTSLTLGGPPATLAGVTPATVSRSSAGDTVNFNDINLAPGGQTEYVVVATNATTFALAGDLSLIDGGTSNNLVYAPSGVPATDLPVPLSMWGGLGLMGLIGGVSVRRRFHQIA